MTSPADTDRPGARKRRPRSRALPSGPTLLLLAAVSSGASAQLSGQDIPFVWSHDLEEGAVTGLQLGGAMAAGDFDGDGRDDLAIGAPGADVGGQSAAGRVYVLYSRGAGFGRRGVAPSLVESQLLHQNTPYVGGVAEAGDRFGAALGVGDFDGDGYDDLAIGAPGEAIGSAIEAGIVHVIPGGPDGLRIADEEPWDHAHLGGTIQAYANFGAALAADDFDGDGRDDLVVGIPGETVTAITHAGAIVFTYGSDDGIDGVRRDWLSQYQLGAHNSDLVVRQEDQFGWSLTTGDFDHDGVPDLAIGVPGDEIAGALETVYNAGSVNVVLGSTGSGLRRQGNFRLTGDPQFGAGYGTALATGDVDGDGRDDLVVSAPQRDHEGTRDAGLVRIDFQTSPGVFGTHGLLDEAPANRQPYDQIGGSLASADLDGDGCDEVIAGNPHDHIVAPDAGTVIVRPGLCGAPRAQFYVHQSRLGVAGRPEAQDLFGKAVVTGNFAGHGPMLAVAVPGEDYTTHDDTGIVQFLDGPRIFADGFESGSLVAWE